MRPAHITLVQALLVRAHPNGLFMFVLCVHEKYIHFHRPLGRLHWDVPGIEWACETLDCLDGSVIKFEKRTLEDHTLVGAWSSWKNYEDHDEILHHQGIFTCHTKGKKCYWEMQRVPQTVGIAGALDVSGVLTSRWPRRLLKKGLIPWNS